MERGGVNTFSLDTAGNPKQARWPYYNDSYVVKSTAIRQEIRDIEQGIMDRTNNPLKVNLWNDYYIEFSIFIYQFWALTSQWLVSAFPQAATADC